MFYVCFALLTVVRPSVRNDCFGLSNSVTFVAHASYEITLLKVLVSSSRHAIFPNNFGMSHAKSMVSLVRPRGTCLQYPLRKITDFAVGNQPSRPKRLISVGAWEVPILYACVFFTTSRAKICRPHGVIKRVVCAVLLCPPPVVLPLGLQNPGSGGGFPPTPGPKWCKPSIALRKGTSESSKLQNMLLMSPP